jgi:hypothetical protein
MSRNNIDTFQHRILAGVVLAPAAIQTTEEIFLLGKAENFGCDWDLASGAAISFRIEILQSNEQEGPYTKWSSPSAAGTTRVNTLNTAIAQDGSDFNLTPSSYCKVKVTNLGAADLTINRLTFFLQ